jgi:hypothetical protein
MTDLAPAVARSDAPSIPASPPARRLGRPRWRDTRLLIGVLLVLVSVVVGARVFAAAGQTRQWVVARADLPAGHVVTADDLTTASADLSDAVSSRYYPGGRLGDVVGGTLARPVSAGELVSGADFAGAAVTSNRLVPVIVKSGRMPKLSPGDHVDVYAFQRDGAVPQASPGTGQPVPATGTGVEVMVLHDVEFVSSEALPSGGSTLTLRVANEDAIRAVAASQSERVDVVKIERDGRGEVGDRGPTATPGFGP